MTSVHRLSTYNEHANVRTEPWKKLVWSDESCFLSDQVIGWVYVCHLPGKELAAGWTMGRRQADGDVMVYLETLWSW